MVLNMKFIDFLKQIDEETTSADIATVDQKFPNCDKKCTDKNKMIKRRLLDRNQKRKQCVDDTN